MAEQLGSVGYLEAVLRKRGRDNTFEKKLPVVLAYLYAEARRSPSLDLCVMRRDLDPFLGASVQNRRKFLDALDKARSKLKPPPSCIHIEFGREQGCPIQFVRLLHQDLRAALLVLTRTLLLDWRDVLETLECTDEDINKLRHTTDVPEPRKATRPSVSRPTMLAASPETRLSMREVPLKRGKGQDTRWKNLCTVLEELWRIQREEVITERQLGGQKKRRRSHFDDLSKLGCLELVVGSGGRGRPGIEKIRLLEREVPKPEVKEVKIEAQEHPSSQSGSPEKLRIPEGFMLVRKPEPAEEDPRSHTFVFIDGANLAGQVVFANVLRKMNAHAVSKKRMLPDEDINWRAFLHFIERGYEDRGWLHLKKTFLFTHISSKLPVERRDNIEQKLRLSILGTNVKLIFYRKENVDPGLAGKMGSVITKALLRGKTKKITVVLVSGDGDYVDTLEDLKSTAREEGVSLRVWILGWKGRISKELEKLADYVTYLQDIVSILDRDAAEKLESERRMLANLHA